jgi:hypothetical protein
MIGKALALVAVFVSLGLAEQASALPPLPPERPADLQGGGDSAGPPLPPPRPQDLTAPALAENPPLPPPRPANGGAATPLLAMPQQAPREISAPPPPPISDCARTAAGRFLAVSLPPIQGPGSCGVADPVRLDAVLLADGSRVAVSPPVVMRCALASEVADWIREDVAPAMASDGDALTQITGAGAYECRTRDHIVGAKLSEHARGNAMDLSAFVDRRGDSTMIRPPDGPTPPARAMLIKKIRDGACKRFATVLGPGSDSFHAASLHVDLEARRHGFRLCEWMSR